MLGTSVINSLMSLSSLIDCFKTTKNILILLMDHSFTNSHLSPKLEKIHDNLFKKSQIFPIEQDLTFFSAGMGVFGNFLKKCVICLFLDIFTSLKYSINQSFFPMDSYLKSQSFGNRDFTILLQKHTKAHSFKTV